MGNIKLHEAAEKYGMSYVTLWRKLTKLHEQGLCPLEKDGREWVVDEMWLAGWMACLKSAPGDARGKSNKKGAE